MEGADVGRDARVHRGREGGMEREIDRKQRKREMIPPPWPSG